MAVKAYDGKVSYVGCVLDIGEHNYYDDSDFYAVVVNIEKGIIEEIEYATTRAYCGDSYANIDISEENYIAFLHNAKNRCLRELINANKAQARKIEKGKEVIVVKGRKVPIGTVGTIFWVKEENYDRYNRYCGKTTRLGIKDKDGNVYWTYADNVEVFDAQRYQKSMRQLVRMLKQRRSKAFLTAKRNYNW